MKARFRVIAVAAALLPSAALAHTGAGQASGFLHGFAHPITGLDHILAMAMVGVLAFQLGGRSLWIVPLTFVGVMAVGGALGVAGASIPLVEIGIALSVVVLGAVVALGIRAPLAATMALVAFFAVFHGHAHGSEMPENAAGVAYGIGFLIATALLHLAGIAAGYGIGRAGETYGARLVRATGAVVSVAGIGILTGAL